MQNPYILPTSLVLSQDNQILRDSALETIFENIGISTDLNKLT